MVCPTHALQQLYPILRIVVVAPPLRVEQRVVGRQEEVEHKELVQAILDRLFEGRELTSGFPGAKIRVIPSAHGKLAEGPAEET